MFYWPMAETQTGQKLWTYNCVDTIEEVIRTFEVWESQYTIVKAWAQVQEGSEIAREIKFKHVWTAAE